MLGVPPERTAPEDKTVEAQAQWGWSNALGQLVLLILVSCIVNLLVGGMSQGHPFRGESEDWEWLAAALTASAALALMPVGIMFSLSLLVGWFHEGVDVRRSFRDGLAAAWFFILMAVLAISPLTLGR